MNLVSALRTKKILTYSKPFTITSGWSYAPGQFDRRYILAIIGELPECMILSNDWGIHAGESKIKRSRASKKRPRTDEQSDT